MQRLFSIKIKPNTPVILGNNIKNYQSFQDVNMTALKDFSSSNLGLRLSKRKDLHFKRRLIANCMFVLAIIGLILMIVLIELKFSVNKFTLKARSSATTSIQKPSFIEKFQNFILPIKYTISFTTFFLVSLIFVYHMFDLSIYCLDNCVENIQIILSPRKIFLILVEFLICLVHPFSVYRYENLSTTVIQTSDVYLSLLMFFRLYLVPRILVLNSKLLINSSSESFTYLSKVNINYKFVFKSYMHKCPVYALIGIILLLVMTASWTMKVCESNINTTEFDFFKSIWLIGITFLTIG